jgi:hypothetical protein
MDSRRSSSRWFSTDEAVETALMAENVKETLTAERRRGERESRGAGNSSGATRNVRSTTSGARSGCFNCGGSHRASECKRPPTCFKCGAAGHKSPDCPKNNAAPGRKSVRTVDDGGQRPISMTEAVINGARADLLVDTGSTVSILPETSFAPNAPRGQGAFATANGEPLRVVGMLKDSSLEVSGWRGSHSFYIGEVTTGVLGMDFLGPNKVLVDASSMPLTLSFKSKGEEKSDVNAPVSDVTPYASEVSDDDSAGLERVCAVEKRSHVNYVEAGDLFDETPTARPPSHTSDDIDGLRRQYQGVFTGLGCTGFATHRIETGNAAPLMEPSYRLPQHLVAGAREQMAKMKADGVVRPSKSGWCSPVVLLKKKTGEVRVAIDYRKLNALTKKDAFPMPRIDALLDGLAGSRVYTTLDCRSGYYQVRLREEDCEKTAFRFEGELLEFTRMPFGLVAAPATFCRLVQRLFGDMPNVTVYLDDICVHSPNPKQHRKDLEAVLRRLEEANITLNVDKCHFFQSSVDFLGFRVEGDTVKPMEGKSEAIAEFPRPKTAKELKRFLGLTGYYRAMVKDYARIAAPLYPLTTTKKKYNAKFLWDGESEKAFLAPRARSRTASRA